MSIADRFHPQFVVDSDGRKQAVILSVEEYEELLADLSDLAVAAERRSEETVSHDELMNDLRSDGTI